VKLIKLSPVLINSWGFNFFLGRGEGEFVELGTQLFHNNPLCGPKSYFTG